MRIAGLALAAAAALPAWGSPCVAESGPGTAALVELYTSEGCSSCPPADRWLASLDERYAPGSVVPLALHVRYRDYVGSKDPYATRKLSHLQRMALAYTPQVVLQGRDFRDWASKAFDQALGRINAQPAKARMRLQVLGVNEQGLDVEASVELLQPAADVALYLAAYGSILSHDYAVLEWLGPFPITGRLAERRFLPLLPGAGAENSGAAAFVQDRRSREVLQALLRSTC